MRQAPGGCFSASLVLPGEGVMTEGCLGLPLSVSGAPFVGAQGEPEAQPPALELAPALTTSNLNNQQAPTSPAHTLSLLPFCFLEFYSILRKTRAVCFQPKSQSR